MLVFEPTQLSRPQRDSVPALCVAAASELHTDSEEKVSGVRQGVQAPHSV